ncbi:MAG TPA: OmpH family outer membrane protein [Ignavibacteria bacterium]|nr:OmpH family outer membrane protein [Ignavibacteria bacterium]
MRRIYLKLIILSIFFSGILLAQNSSKIGYIDSQSILKQWPKAQKAQKTIQAAVQKVRTSMDNLQRAYQREIQTYQQQSALMPASRKKKTEQKIANMERRYKQLRGKLDPDGEIAKLNSKLMKPIIDKIQKVTKSVARKLGIKIVLDNNEQVKNIWYADPKLNLTNKVLNKLITGK